MCEKSFRKAVKYGAKLRFAVCGPSGSGKTYTLLQLATELGGPIALVDTEHGSASKYADIFEFDVLELDSYDPLRLIELIDDAVEAAVSSAVHRFTVALLVWQGRRTRKSRSGRAPDADAQ